MPHSTVRLGKSGLTISDYTLGCMSFGTQPSTTHPWIQGPEDAEKIVCTAYDHGIFSFDTSNMYAHGTSEEVLGKIMSKNFRREDVLLSTKVYFPFRDSPLSGGLSRREIYNEIHASLRRLQTDYIDIYIPHRWDATTPIEETLSTFNDLIVQGKIRYLGASSMKAWQLSKAHYTAKLNGWQSFVSMQNHYNLLAREEELEMIPLCEDLHIGLMPWSPLARGKLARPHTADTSKRAQSDAVSHNLYNHKDTFAPTIRARVAELAAHHNVCMSAIALAWLRTKPNVSSPVVGITNNTHFEGITQSRTLSLTPEEVASLERPYPENPPDYM